VGGDGIAYLVGPTEAVADDLATLVDRNNAAARITWQRAEVSQLAALPDESAGTPRLSEGILAFDVAEPDDLAPLVDGDRLASLLPCRTPRSVICPLLHITALDPAQPTIWPRSLRATAPLLLDVERVLRSLIVPCCHRKAL